MNNFNVEEDLAGIQKIQEYEKHNQFMEYEKIYPWTNENLRWFSSDFNLKNKKILTVTSSGDHYLNMVLNQAEDITCFDINKLAKYYQELKISIIKLLDYDDLKKILYSSSTDDVLLAFFKKNKSLFSNVLRKEVYDFWCYTLDNYKPYELLSGDVKPFSFENNEYFDKEYYQLLQDKLAVVSPIYIDCDIININKKLKDKYDYIFTSNMFYYLMKKGTHGSVFDNLIHSLNLEGRIIQYSLAPHFKNDLYFEKRRNYDTRILYKYEDVHEGYYESIISYGIK